MCMTWETWETDPPWGRTLYKRPSKKHTGDLLWRILHGAIATIAFLSVTVLNKYPFCRLSEDVFFNVFTECRRLTGFVSVLTAVLHLFGIVFSGPLFICGVILNKMNKLKCRLLNFGEAKLAIYLSRRDRLEAEPKLDAVALWRCNIKARLKLELWL